MSPRPRPLRLPVWGVLGLLALAVTWAGCARSPVAPEVAPAASVNAAAPGSDQLLGGLGGLLGLGGGSSSGPRPWYVVKSQWVAAGTETVVQGSNYRLSFHTGSLSQGAQIKISEYDPNICDFQLEPHGTQFGTPVDLVVDYRGTNIDPLSVNWDGTLPVFLWLNPSTNLWEIVAGFNNPLTRTYHVRLQHFSRYQLTTQKPGGTAEW